MNERERVTALFQEYADDVYRYIYFIVNDAQLAEDLTQETFLKVWKKLGQFREQSTIKTWMMTIARHTAFDYLRSQKWFLTFVSDDYLIRHCTMPSTEQLLLQKMEVQQLYVALKKLKGDYQQVIVLRKLHHCTIRETADVLGWSENKVKAKLARALKKLELEMQLQQEGYDGKSTQI